MKFKRSLVCLILIFAGATIACEKPTTSQTKATAMASTSPEPTRVAALPDPTPAQPPTQADLKNHWKQFGVAGQDFRNMKPGEFGGGEGGLTFMKTFSGQMWSIDFEPLDRRDVPLDTRLIYLAQISSDSSKKVLCGAALPDFHPAPAHCIVQEKILTWKHTRQFFQGKIRNHKANFATIELFLRKRGNEKIPYNLEADAAQPK